jgi:Na+-driven multidrug efflux pump
MIISGSLNVALNFLLCLVLTQKVMAVAIATAASQIAGALLVGRRILTLDGFCRLRLKSGRWDWRSFKLLLTNGLPIGFSSALYSLANLQIQTALNSYGAMAIAGSSATVNIEGIAGSLAATPWGSTVGVFVGQNVGADNKKRVKHSILVCTAIAVGIAAFIGIFVMTFSRAFLSLFVDSDEAIAYGQIRMLYIILPYVVAALNTILSNSIQAFGYSIFSTVNSIFCVFVFRMIWMRYVYPLMPTFHVLMQCFLVSWLLIAVVNLVFFFYLYYKKFKAGKIKKMG